MTKIFLYFYQIIRSIRYALIMSAYGSVSHCPHQPTCGTKFTNAIRKKSYSELKGAISQLITCV